MYDYVHSTNTFNDYSTGLNDLYVHLVRLCRKWDFR